MKKANTRADMPSKNAIAKHWGVHSSDYCWGCGVDALPPDRCHLLSRVNGGSNNPDNFILLCKFCHNNIQEHLAGKTNHAESVKRLFKKVHLPFFAISHNFRLQKAYAGLINIKHDTSKLKGFYLPVKTMQELIDDNL